MKSVILTKIYFYFFFGEHLAELAGKGLLGLAGWPGLAGWSGKLAWLNREPKC